MQRIVQILRLVDDPAAIAAYRKAHDEIWPEVVEGIRAVGIERMDLFLQGRTVVMLVELPDAIDFDEAMAALAPMPRQQQWEEFVGKYQLCQPGSTSAAKWQRMAKIFGLPDESK